MRHSEFWRLMEDEFGAAYARGVAADQSLLALGGRTVEQALADGERPKDVWRAVCDQMDVPPDRRWGADPPRR